MKRRSLSVRAITVAYSVPRKIVVKAIDDGTLPALKTLSTTGQKRAYVMPEDAEAWINELREADIAVAAQA